MLRDDEMPELPWQTVEDGIPQLREVGQLEWVYYVKSEAHVEDYVTWEGTSHQEH